MQSVRVLRQGDATLSFYRLIKTIPGERFSFGVNPPPPTGHLILFAPLLSSRPRRGSQRLARYNGRQCFVRFQVNPFDLLGQNEIYPIAVYLPGTGEPKLTIAWNSFHQNFFSELAAFFRWTRVPKGEATGKYLRRLPHSAAHPLCSNPGCRSLARRIFCRAVAAHFHGAPKHVTALDNTELTWSGNIEDLPLLNVPKQGHKVASPKTPPADAPAAENTDAYHPRQRIFTDPSHPTHPRQTLVNTSAPMEPPKFVPQLPNMVNSPARPPRSPAFTNQRTNARQTPSKTSEEENRLHGCAYTGRGEHGDPSRGSKSRPASRCSSETATGNQCWVRAARV